MAAARVLQVAAGSSPRSFRSHVRKSCELPSCAANHLRRGAEDELVAVAEEKERLAPAVEEARWRGRQLERELGEAQVGAR